jgi:hypothetical protein
MCVNAKKFTINVGEKYGPYIVIENVIKQNKKSIERRFKVRHEITNKEFIMRPSYLNKVNVKYLEKLESGEFQRGLKNYLYNSSLKSAEIRNHSFNISFSEFMDIITKNCHYCGDIPSRCSNKIIITRGHINEPVLYYNGIDRINSLVGYVLDNIVPCCSVCNYMKHTQTKENFLNQISKIYHNQKK